MTALDILNRYFSRAWVCQVVRTGFHNGAHCSPKDPHGDWDCGYRNETSLTDEEYERFKEALA